MSIYPFWFILFSQYWWMFNDVFLGNFRIWPKNTWFFLRLLDDVTQLQITHIPSILELWRNDSSINFWFQFFRVVWILRDLYSTHTATIKKRLVGIFISTASIDDVRTQKGRVSTSWPISVIFLLWGMISFKVSDRKSSSSFCFTLLPCFYATIFMDFIPFLDKL